MSGAHAFLYVFAALMALAAWIYVQRNGGGKALEELERVNRILAGRVDDLERSDATKARRIAELEAKTDVSVVANRVLEALERHEDRAAERSKRTISLLGLIADRLGPEQAEG